MSMRNSEVVGRWANNKKATNGRRSLWTDGSDLFSYNLRIGLTSPHGIKAVIEHRAPHFVSQTTSCHVGIAISETATVIHPNFVPGAN